MAGRINRQRVGQALGCRDLTVATECLTIPSVLRPTSSVRQANMGLVLATQGGRKAGAKRTQRGCQAGAADGDGDGDGATINKRDPEHKGRA